MAGILPLTKEISAVIAKWVAVWAISICAAFFAVETREYLETERVPYEFGVGECLAIDGNGLYVVVWATREYYHLQVLGDFKGKTFKVFRVEPPALEKRWCHKEIF